MAALIVKSGAKYQQYEEYKDSGVEWLGEIPKDWKMWKIAHAYLEIGSGTTPPSSNEEWYVGDIPWITTGELREKIILDTKKKVSKKTIKAFPTLRIYPVGSIAIAMYGATIGRLGILGIEATTNQACCVMSQSKVIFNNFLYYWMQAFKDDIVRLSSGGGQPNINQETVASLKVSIPQYKDQVHITKFLDHETAQIDTLIEKQQTLIQLLKEKRQAVISHAVTKGLNPDVPMKGSGVEWLGEVPEHWEVSKLKYYSSIQGGYAFSSDSFTEEGVQILKIGNVYQNRLALERQPTFVPEVMLEALPDFIVKDGDILMSLTGTLGKRDYGFAVAIKDDGKYLLNQRVAKLNPADEKIDRDFLLNVLWSESYLNQLYSLPSGTKQANLSNSDVLDIVITLPPSKTEQKKIAVELQNQKDIFDKAIQKAMTSIELMQERRTALISAAVTGKIDVRGWVAADVPELN